ncbi:uncharacterized protein PHALS_12833 [Plasmopara halstedii]|uniref:Uncharacterized protein n=1 Tax=Plasmopara halstedii TaxID=4781 RepID=A0A0N7L5W0_PLAHL|nr:uncharacterized protein PHALS_12833 [Plasmopara halstedii]CEG42571.1 hypothetical protein PHALS_12833 [Plasmopara halstedii]|eukprot:XP_024578940.1 hypothetical protein PHALS_12833 [Plasmopara halstedii]
MQLCKTLINAKSFSKRWKWATCLMFSMLPRVLDVHAVSQDIHACHASIFYS